ncbi:SDR family NAD(P)-dependent oxidoreductase [Sediminitomix flava]|uniref:Short subunit dehydrogenase n=1 Tax=Sediminitomix flava TaxID=379075 RepID=A0A315ZA74_SEDFL|nr:SDR family NAD(P)-dependent oxidoreductase [Sediminitomix flava]PWJ41104.1 short subunit dehydrogenase [Sediminitomix flava]
MEKSKIALVTGATDGIGKATAIALAQKGYAIHVIGRNKTKGAEVISTLEQVNSEGKHLFFSLDLSNMNEVQHFLKAYTNSHNTLDILVLNAGIFPKEMMVSADGIDVIFALGYMSRYLFSEALHPLLIASGEGKVVYVGTSAIVNIKYDQLTAPKYNKMFATWQQSTANAYLVQFGDQLFGEGVARLHWLPGIVNTGLVKSQSRFVQFLSSMFGMIEAEEAGETLASILVNHNVEELKQKFFKKGKQIKTSKKVINGIAKFEELIEYTKQFLANTLEEKVL